ncbi:MipA/OmpV family protein [Brucellaceae bacterium C25G]
MRKIYLTSVTILGLLAGLPVQAADNVVVEEKKPFWAGDWSLTVGGLGEFAPRYDGSGSYKFFGEPLISLSRAGDVPRFDSPNDNFEFALIDTYSFSAGLTGKLLFKRDSSTSKDLKGLDPVRFGGELGGFAEFYPVDWMRVRGELRQGIRAHKGIVGEVAADAFYDVTPVLRVSGGPRVSFASKDYFKAYYGVNAQEAIASGLSEYHPGGGLKSLGAGAALTWKTTDKITTSFYGEYENLQGPAKKSSLVEERGKRDQFSVGVTATYRFDFTLD